MFVNEGRKVIEMSEKEYKNAMTYGTEEYRALRELRNDYPLFRPFVVKTKKVKNTLNRVTMKFIREYVKTKGSKEQKEAFLTISTTHVNENGLLITAQPFCDIKKWFFAEFPEVKKTCDDHDAEIKKIYDAVDEKIAEAQKKAIEDARAKAKEAKEKYIA